MAVGLALVQYGREEGAEGMIEQMTQELVRRGQGQCCWEAVRGSEGPQLVAAMPPACPPALPPQAFHCLLQ